MDVRRFMKKSSATAKAKRKYVRKARAPRVQRVGKALTQAIKSVVTKQMETKNVAKICENYVLHNSPILGGDWTYPLPPVPQGVGENQRIGDRLKPKALIVKLHVSFNSVVGGFDTIMARVHILKHKKFTSEAQLALNMPTDGLLLLNDGNGNILSYDGTLIRSQYALNTDLWTSIKTLSFPMSKDNTAPVQGAVFREFTIRIPCPKVLTYASAVATTPENFCPAMAVGYTYTDGTAPDVAGTPIVVVSQSFFTYTDA